VREGRDGDVQQGSGRQKLSGAAKTSNVKKCLTDNVGT
jgi:hypothetical protein